MTADAQPPRRPDDSRAILWIALFVSLVLHLYFFGPQLLAWIKSWPIPFTNHKHADVELVAKPTPTPQPTPSPTPTPRPTPAPTPTPKPSATPRPKPRTAQTPPRVAARPKPRVDMPKGSRPRIITTDHGTGPGMSNDGSGKVGVPDNPNGVPDGGPAGEPSTSPTPRSEPTVAARPLPTPTPTPARPRGPTRDAAAISTPLPTIPDALRHHDLRTAVRVQFDVSASGAASPTLIGTTGNAELDSLALSACRRWRFSPRLEDGVAVPSTVRYTVRFVVD